MRGTRKPSSPQRAETETDVSRMSVVLNQISFEGENQMED